MTTAYRDTATRCERCQRVTLGCADVSLMWDEELVTIEVAQACLCTRCRSLVIDRFREAVKPPAMVNDR